MPYFISLLDIMCGSNSWRNALSLTDIILRIYWCAMYFFSHSVTMEWQLELCYLRYLYEI